MYLTFVAMTYILVQHGCYGLSLVIAFLRLAAASFSLASTVNC